MSRWSASISSHSRKRREKGGESRRESRSLAMNKDNTQPADCRLIHTDHFAARCQNRGSFDLSGNHTLDFLILSICYLRNLNIKHLTTQVYLSKTLNSFFSPEGYPDLLSCYGGECENCLIGINDFIKSGHIWLSAWTRKHLLRLLDGTLNCIPSWGHVNIGIALAKCSY